MKKLFWLLFLICATASAQNWICRLASTLPATDPYVVQNGPLNWAVEWVDVGTNLTVPASFGVNYTFVGNNAARDAFIAARQTTTWLTWNTATGGVFRSLSDKTNNLTTISNNLLTVRNLFQSNIAFVSMVATNQPAVMFTTNLAVSNQLVTLSRLFNQIAPLLKDSYKGD